MVNIECVSEIESELNHVSNWLEKCAKTEGKTLGEIGVVLGADDWLLDYNIQYLDHDFYTDIITFDYVEGDIISGDLLISIDRVNENAAALNVSRETELNRVIIHGFLHLCGYSDKTKEEKQIMRKKEDFYLELL